MPIDNSERIKWFSALVVLTGISGGTGTYIGAPDRFTGSEGRELEKRLRVCEAHLATPHPPLAIYSLILGNSSDIKNHIDKHHYRGQK